LTRLLHVYDRLLAGLVAVAGVVLLAVCLLIAWDVVARNLGLQPPESTVALTEYALLYVTMAAAPWLVRTRGHVAIEIFHARLGVRTRRAVDRAICACCAVLSLAVAGLALILAVEAVQRGELDVRSLDIPRLWLFVPLVVGFALMGTEFLRLMLLGTLPDPAPEQRSAL
jgi:TRAP-type C4-dicarboxylate transport system permease small subunit